MSNNKNVSLEEFGATFKAFMEQAISQAPQSEPVFEKNLKELFQTDLAKLPVVSEKFIEADRPNLQLALENYLGKKDRTHQLLGINLGAAQYMGVQMVGLLYSNSFRGMPAPTLGPIEYKNVDLDNEEVIACVKCGLYLIKESEEVYAVLLGGEGERGYVSGGGVKIEVMAQNREAAKHFLGNIRAIMRKQNVYRGKVISLGVDGYQQISVNYHQLPPVSRQSVILPSGILEQIERNAISFTTHKEKLLKSKRHLKRGILLYGPPGTGKTYSMMYLVNQMKERTVILITGRAFGLLEQSCAMARILDPSVVILEDVDLIATERTHQNQGCNALLFELLNQMDGLADDVDVLFLLTTNRPEILEPALAARPGRIDMAVEIPLPDKDCRRRLFELYGRGLTINIGDLERYIDKTEGVSAAFIRELLRKAALYATEDLSETVVEKKHLDDALRDLLLEGNKLTQSLLGVHHTPTKAT